MANNEIEEIRKAVERYFKYIWKVSSIQCVGDKIDGNQWNNIFKDNKLNLPFPIIVIGAEPKFQLNEDWDDTEGYLDKIEEWKYLYELFPEKVGYVSAPFNPELMLIDIAEINKSLNINVKKIDELWKKIRNKININIIHKNLKFFFREAGEYFSAENLTEKGAITHETAEQTRFLQQLANLVAGCILFLKEDNSEPKKVLLLDNNPERKMVDIDTHFEAIFKKNIIPTLKDILEWMEGFIDIYYYKKEFATLSQKLAQVEQEEDETLKVTGKNRSKNEVRIKDFDFILVDIFLGENQPNGIEIIKLLTSKYPSIPCFALSVSDDFSIIRDAIKEGADYYILKNQIFSVLYIYYSYLKELGKILEFLK